MHRELRRKGVTLRLLWQESYQAKGIGYSQFCRHYRAYCKMVDVVMHFSHRAGENAFVDYAATVLRKIFS